MGEVAAYRVGERIRIIDGPFMDFSGIVEAASEQDGKVQVIVDFFGRETPVQLKPEQIAKIA